MVFTLISIANPTQRNAAKVLQSIMEKLSYNTLKGSDSGLDNSAIKDKGPPTTV